MKRVLACIAAVLIAPILGCGGDLRDAKRVAPTPGLTSSAAPVAEPITADPTVGHVRGTMILVHGGGWRGHDAHAQQIIMQSPGRLLLARGWRVVSIDTHEGKGGVQDVLDAAGSELERRTSNGPLCLYGESSGAHLALVAAARLRAIDCVIGVGTPTDLALYESEGATTSNALVRAVARQVRRFFGTTTAELAPWDPVSLAPRIRASVLLLRGGDDALVSATHAQRFRAASPATRVVALPAGNPALAADGFVHGTISARGRAEYAAEIGAFIARARRSESR